MLGCVNSFRYVPVRNTPKENLRTKKGAVHKLRFTLLTILGTPNLPTYLWHGSLALDGAAKGHFSKSDI